MQSRKELRDLKRTLTKVRKSEEKIKNLSDEELSALTEQFKSRYSDGESLESLMPEAFAAICEADYRVLGKRPYDVQILAAAALHGGYLAEMNTGEGKTLSATMPLYLNALTGKSCMLVTTNEYLASRDGAEMGEVYNFMGLSCSYPDADDTKKQDDDEKRQFYSADIIYTTNGTLGFDFLFDNLVKKKEDRFLCDFHYVIIDEADSVLLDSAIMPLVISGVPRVQSNLYDVCDFFVTTLVEDIDYIEEDKAVWLTPKGVKFAESFFGISNFYGKENFEINRHVTLSLRAHKLLKNKKDYVVTDKKEVELFDGATGRLMHGVKLRGGQHQAIEAKEKLQRYIDGKKRIGKRKIKRIVNQCQKLSVESEEMNRKKSLQYDQVLQRQRDLIYATRKKLLDGASVEQEKIVEIAKGNISDFVNHFDCIQSNNKHGRRRGRKKDNDKNTNTQQYTSMLNRYILDNISYKLDAGLTLSDMQSAATVSDYLMLRVYQGLSRQREHIGDEEAYEQFVREATLKAVDDGWVELIDYLEQLKYAVAGRASAQRNVMFEYQNEAFESFLDTEKAVKCNIIRNILLSDVKIGKDGRLQVIYP